MKRTTVLIVDDDKEIHCIVLKPSAASVHASETYQSPPSDPIATTGTNTTAATFSNGQSDLVTDVDADP